MNFKDNPIFQKLAELGLEDHEYAIFGSGIMFAIGARPLSDLDDIDLVVSQSGWEKVKNLAEIKVAPDWGCEYITLYDEQIELYSDWGPGEYDVTELIETSVNVDGINFVNEENTIRWKREMGRDKDLKHIDMIMAASSNSDN